MKVGDYVRTESGLIGKIIDINLGDFQTRYELDNSDELHYEYKNDIIKSSPNVIDLIEVGDYVNGIRVDDIKNGQLKTISWYDGYLCHLCSDYEIKTIATKEQFEAMQYNLENKGE